MRIVGINIPDEKRIVIALTYIFGVGKTRAGKIIESTGIDAGKKSKDLTTEEVNRVKEYIQKTFEIEGDLKRKTSQNIKRKKDTGSYQGLRHAHGLPVRGQKTKTNSRTVRGNVRRTMGSGRKPPGQKT